MATTTLPQGNSPDMPDKAIALLDKLQERIAAAPRKRKRKDPPLWPTTRGPIACDHCDTPLAYGDCYSGAHVDVRFAELPYYLCGDCCDKHTNAETFRLPQIIVRDAVRRRAARYSTAWKRAVDLMLFVYWQLPGDHA